MRSRLVILVVAVVLGLIAAAMTGRYLASLERGVAAEDEPIEVLVAQEEIDRGMSAEEILEAGLVVRESIPRRYVAEGAVSSPASIEGQVLAEQLTAGEQVTQARFRFPSQAGLAFSIPDDFVAVTIANDAVKGVAGLVKPSDHVMVVVTLDPGPDGEAVTQVLLPRARVLAVGSAVGTESSQPATGGGGGGLVGAQQGGEQQTASTITLALSPADVEKLVYAEEKGSVWLALLGSTDAQTPETAGQTLQSLLSE
ncbi:MAG: Flp pilus assembly protein CpaB [Coriobacteriia bacterium]|nr:Flp pilus assembly protein CpaB [Coriobacteriia bacterium]